MNHERMQELTRLRTMFDPNRKAPWIIDPATVAEQMGVIFPGNHAYNVWAAIQSLAHFTHNKQEFKNIYSHPWNTVLQIAQIAYPERFAALHEDNS